jgi:hypothetical protein
MSNTKNSISSLLEQILRDNANSMEIISKLSEIATSSADSVSFNLLQADGTTQVVQIPAFGFMNNKIDRVDSTVQSMAGIGDSSAMVKLPDGTSKQIFTASILRDPAAISSLQVPLDFKIRNNWFFESFLNPLLFVSFDVTGKVPDNMKKAVVKRLILNADTQDKKDYFDGNFKGKNDIIYADFLNKMSSAGIELFTDEENVELPTSVMRYRGTFDILKIVDEDVSITSNNTTVTVKKRKYKLNKMTYTDILSGTVESKTIHINDKVVTADGTLYIIDAIDMAENTAVLRRIQGSQAIGIGVDVITIYSPPYMNKEIQVNVGFDERQVIFVKPIDATFEVAASQYSPGIGIYSNELTITTPAGPQTLSDFYKTQVTDFGQIFLNSAKEKHIPAVHGETPDAPVLDATNFKIVQINAHKKDTKEIDDIKQKLASQVSLDNEIKQLEAAIDNKKNDLNNAAINTSDVQKKKLKADLDDLAKQKSSKVNLYASTVKQIATKAQENPSILEPAKYRVRGFWAIPSPKTSDLTQDQEVIQFRVSYRYIRKDGNAPGTEQMEFTDIDGTKKRGYFSNWTEYKSDIRKRIYNTNTGFYEWVIEDVSNADTTNINQLDIPISKNEQVQVRVASISEAGYPLNAQESVFSNVITVDFPNDLQITDESANILTSSALEDSRMSFQASLDARGLDLHLLNSFTSGDQYYSHVSDDIASGFFDSAGKVINLFNKLKDLDNQLSALQAIIAKAKGTLAVYLIDETGNVTTIAQNTTTKIFAGYYKDLITSGSGTSITYNHGQIITKSYILRVENSAATALELASILPGGIGQACPVSDPVLTPTSADYDKNRRYDLVPLSLTGASTANSGDLKQVAPFQSQQVKSMWMYSREKSVGLDEDLYLPTSAYNTVNSVPTSGAWPSGYQYQGVLISGTTVPMDGYHLLPFNPTFSGTLPNTSVTDVSVWNGTTDGASAAVGGGQLTEFCISIAHPDITTFGPSHTWVGTDFSTTGFTGTGPYVMKYPKFIHSIFFSEDTNSSFGKKQIQTVIPATATSLNFASPDNTMFPPKLGFTKNDEFLIGKYTCGAYLYLAPIDYVDIAVEGSTDLAKKTLEFGEANGINIPLIFQFRCSDKLNYIGGFRQAGNLTNISYTKKAGIDISVRNEALFSFDVEVSCKYQQDSLVTPVYVPNVSLDRLNAIRAGQGRG